MNGMFTILNIYGISKDLHLCHQKKVKMCLDSELFVDVLRSIINWLFI